MTLIMNEEKILADDRPFSISSATVEDVEAVCLIECEAARIFCDIDLEAIFEMPGLTRPEIRQAINDKTLWMARWTELDMVVGFALARHVDGQAHLKELDVLPGFQKRNIGRALVDAVLDWARNEGFEHVTLTTFKNVPWNAPYYHRLGFETLAETDRGLELNSIVRQEQMLGLEEISPRTVMVFRL